MANRPSARGALVAWSLALAFGSGAAAAAPGGAPSGTLFEQGRAYEHGEGVERDPLRAQDLYCAAIRLGDVDAMHALGWMYANGRGVGRNDSLASTLFAMAAVAGDPQAEAMLKHLGGHRGEVPDCLIPSSRARAVVFSGEWRLDRYLDSLSPARRPFAELIARQAAAFDIDPRLALAVASAESDFDPGVVSPRKAMGLMQLIPETAERFNVRDALDPVQNVRGGLAYLRWLLAYFEGNVALAAAGYNAGEGAVDRYRGVPPYRETRRYVERVTAFFPHARHRYREGLVGASPIVTLVRQLAGGAMER